MISLLTEQPILVSIALGLLAVTLLYIWNSGAPRAVGIAGGVALACIPVAWLIATLVVTDQEAVQQTIRDLADSVEANDFEAAYAAIDSSRPRILERVKAELPRYEFTRARVGGFNRLRILDDVSPKEAVVDLTASVRVSTRGGLVDDQVVARRLFLRMVETESGWKVIDYAHRPPVGPSDGFSSDGNTDWDRLLQPPAP